MKTKILSFLLAGGLLALAAWLVQLNTSVDLNSQNAQGGEPKPDKEVPEKYRQTVDKGLEYLVKSQFKDGHWEGDGGKHPVAMTGLVGLALLMEGSSYGEKYKTNTRNAADWLMDKSQAGGLLFSDHPSETARYMQGHGLATLFLAGACRHERDDERRKK